MRGTPEGERKRREVESKMATLENAITAHMDVNGERFELLVDPDLGLMYKTGKKAELNNVLVVEEIFKNAKKGERHKSDALKKAFGTDDIWKIADIIIKKGDLQLTTDQKRKMLDDKRKQIISILARESIDPRTGAPHTVLRIEQAMEHVKAPIDPFKPAEAQLETILKEMRLLLPMKFERIRIAAKIGPEHAQRIYGSIKEYGIQKEEWTKNGELIIVVEIPAGLQSEFYDRLNRLTAGSAQTTIVK